MRQSNPTICRAVFANVWQPMFGDTDEPTPPLTYPPAKKGFNKALLRETHG